MSSEYVKWLQRDVVKKADSPPGPKDRLLNWWHYHKWLVVGALVLLWVLLGLLWNAWGPGRVQADYQVAYVGTNPLPSDTAQALTQALEELGTDLNGDGRVVVQLHEYPFPDASDGSETAAAIQAASETALMADLMECESYFFLLEDPDTFQLRYQALALPDGSCPADTDRSGRDKAILWTAPRWPPYPWAATPRRPPGRSSPAAATSWWPGCIWPAGAFTRKTNRMPHMPRAVPPSGRS